MGDKKPRWSSRTLRRVFPLPAERQTRPRFDGAYVTADRSVAARFLPDGAIEFAGADGTWSVEQGRLSISTPAWTCEGTLDLDAAYLLCSGHGHTPNRSQLELHFAPERRGE